MNVQTIHINRDLAAERRAVAEAFRQDLTARGTYAVRLLSSPGAGKTTLLQSTVQQLSPEYSVGVLVGDVETERDAERLAPYAPTKQITTGGACHLELPLVEKSLPALGDRRFDLLFIEDVGNLICPASHDLGEHVRVILLSTTEGDDKPGKYPKAFRTSQVMVISKLDLLPYVPFSVERAALDARVVQPEMIIYPLCATSGEGMAAWCDFLISSRRQTFADAGPRQSCPRLAR